MTNPADALLFGQPQQGMNPADALLQSPAEQDYPPKPEDSPEIGRIKALLNRQDIRPEQRSRLEEMLQSYSALPKPESALRQFGETGAQAALAPIAGVAATLGKVPGLGVPFRPIAGGLENVIQKLEPNEASANPWAQYLGTLAGSVAGSVPVFKGAQVATQLLGAAAQRIAPTIAGRALAGIATAAEGVAEQSPRLASMINAAPGQLSSGLIFQGAQDPSSLTTPQGLGLATAFGLFGAVAEGARYGTELQRKIQGAKTIEDLSRVQDGLDALYRHQDATAQQNEGIKFTEGRAGQSPDVPPAQLPNALEAANVRLNVKASEAAESFMGRVEKIWTGRHSVVQPLATDLPQPTLATATEPTTRLKLIDDEINNAIFKSEADKSYFAMQVQKIMDTVPGMKIESAANTVARAMRLSQVPNLVDVQPVYTSMLPTELQMSRGSKLANLEPNLRPRPSVLTIDEINDSYRKSVTAYNDRLTAASRSQWNTPGAANNRAAMDQLASQINLLADAIEGKAQVARNTAGRIVPAPLLVDGAGRPIAEIPHPPTPAEVVARKARPAPITAANPVVKITQPSIAAAVEMAGPEAPFAHTGKLSKAETTYQNTPEGQDAMAQRLLGTKSQQDAFARQWKKSVDDRSRATATPAGQAGQNILDRITTPADNGSMFEGISTRGFWKDKASKLYMHTVDGTAPLRQFGTNVHNLARLARSYGSSAEYFINHGTLDSNFNPDGGPGLRAILAGENNSLMGRENELLSYMVSARAMEVGAAKVGVDEASARMVVSNAKPEIVQAHQQMIDWSRKLTAIAEAEGMLEPGTLDHFKDISQNYTYLRRMFEEPGQLKGGYKSDNLGAKQLYMRFSGSDRQIVNPIVAEIVRTERVMKAVYQNRALQGWSDYVTARPALMQEMGIRQVVDGTEANTPGVMKEAKNYLENARQQGYSLNMGEAKQMALMFGNKTSHVEGNTVELWKDGRILRYEVPHEIAQAFTSLNPMELEWYQQFLGLPARALKAGVTLNPVFQAYNIIRDSYDATLNSQFGFKFGIDSFKGLYEAVTRGDAWKQWRAAGGGFHTISTAGGKEAGRLYRDVLPKTMAGQVIQLVKHPIELLKTMSAPFEEATRLGEFMAAKGQGTSTIEAVMAANAVTTDFKQIGLSMHGLSAMTAFLNPAVQSLDNTFKSIARSPIKVGLKGFAAISIPTMYIWFANKDDQEIQDLRKTDAGLSSWFIRTPQGDIVKLPKPFLYGQIFGTSMETALDKAYMNDPAAIERLGQGLWDQASVAVLPTVLQAYVSLQANKDFFTGSPIVPLDKQELAPGFQTQFQTGPIAKGIGEKLNMSPAKIEFMTRQLLGSSGADLVKIGDRLVAGNDPNQPATSVDTDFPFFGRFKARYPTMGVEPVRTFYDNATKMKEVVNTMNYLGRERPYELQAYVQSHTEEIGLASVYAQTRAEISKIRKNIEEINGAPSVAISPDEKRKTIEYLLRQVIEITRTVNQAIDAGKMSGMNPTITSQSIVGQ